MRPCWDGVVCCMLMHVIALERLLQMRLLSAVGQGRVCVLPAGLPAHVSLERAGSECASLPQQTVWGKLSCTAKWTSAAVSHIARRLLRMRS